MKPFIFLHICMLAGTTGLAQDTTTVNYNDIHDKRVKITGQLGKPFGTIVTVKGVLVDYFSKQGDGGPNLIVQMINDSATQQFIRIPLRALRGVDETPIAKLQFGATYTLRVFEEGQYTGTPPGMYDQITSAPQVVRYHSKWPYNGNRTGICTANPALSVSKHFVGNRLGKNGANTLAPGTVF